MSAPGRHLLLCVPEAPDATRQSGSLRLLNIVEMLVEGGWQVTMVSTYPGRHMDRRRFLRMGVPIFTEESLGEVLTGNEIDVALIAFWETAERLIPAIRSRSPETKIVLDSVDVHFVRRTREQLTTGAGGTEPSLDSTVGSEYIREMNTYVRADAVITVSSKEAQLLEDLTNGAIRAYCVPDCEDATTYPQSADTRRGIVFLGNFQHPPNRDAVEFLCDEILPHLSADLLREHPISVVGNALADETLEKCRAAAGVVPVGWVPSVIPYLAAARLSIVPLRYGAGTKRKVIQSLMADTPTIVTGAAVEGMGLNDRAGVWIEESPQAFAAAISRIATDDGEWNRLRAGGRAAIAAGFARDHVREILLGTVDRILDGRPADPENEPEPPRIDRPPDHAPGVVAPARTPDRMTSTAIRPPIVILGAPRSGTTYLNRIVNEHPGVFVTHESRIFVWAHRALAMIDDPQVVLSHREQIRDHLERELPGLIRDFYRSLRPQIEHWGDKNPHYASPVDRGCPRTIERLYPGALFIHVLRDGRDVVTSLTRKTSPDGDPWAPFEMAHDVWNSHITIGHELGAELPEDQFCEIRYEDLIADDVGVARSVFDFLGIEIHDSVISFCEAQQRERTPLSGPTRDLSKGAGESDWHSVFTAEERRRSLELLGENLVRFGYLTEAALAREVAAVETDPNPDPGAGVSRAHPLS